MKTKEALAPCLHKILKATIMGVILDWKESPRRNVWAILNYYHVY